MIYYLLDAYYANTVKEREKALDNFRVALVFEITSEILGVLGSSSALTGALEEVSQKTMERITIAIDYFLSVLQNYMP